MDDLTRAWDKVKEKICWYDCNIR